jgi:para-nitrobenzyl esterase
MSMVKAALAVAIMTSISAVAAAQPASCTVSEVDLACTEQGSVRGVPEGETLAFKGIPYAKPPTGALRWRPPEAPAHWDGVRDGSRLGAMCPQLAGKEVKGEEDCLYLNIWRPREKPGQALPVMVWLTGGGNHAISGQGMPFFGGVVYSGEQLVPQGVIFVSYNLRLGR